MTRHDLDRLADALVPGLAARLDGAVDEIDVAGDGWRIRVKRGGTRTAAVDPRPMRSASSATNGSGPTPTASGYPHPRDALHVGHPPVRVTHADPHRLVATAPAVGVFMPRGGIATGSHVRAGDRLGVVDLLGVPQDVLAPGDGILMSVLVEAGEGVEYGQELLVLEAAAS